MGLRFSFRPDSGLPWKRLILPTRKVGELPKPSSGKASIRTFITLMTLANRKLLWIGDLKNTAEFYHVATVIQKDTELWHLPTVDAALHAATSSTPEPLVICLSETHPGQIQDAEVLKLTRRWPLSKIVVVGSCLADGQRRSGPSLRGVLQVPWHDLPSRIITWMHRLESGQLSSLADAPSFRRDERWLLDATTRKSPQTVLNQPAQVRVTIAASTDTIAEAVSDLVTATGGIVEQAVTGKPPIQDSADIVIWDLHDSPESQLEWIRLLTCQNPHRIIALLCSFPRSESAKAAMDAGATVVLGRPTDSEALCGVLLLAETALSASP